MRLVGSEVVWWLWWWALSARGLGIVEGEKMFGARAAGGFTLVGFTSLLRDFMLEDTFFLDVEVSCYNC